MNRLFQFNDYFEIGQIFHDCTAYQISIEYLDKALELSTYLPINKNRLVKVYQLRGNSKIRLGNYWDSISDFSKAIKLGSTVLPNSYYLRALVDYELGVKTDDLICDDISRIADSLAKFLWSGNSEAENPTPCQ